MIPIAFEEFECDVTFFVCLISFVHMHGCCSIVCLHFQVMKIKTGSLQNEY